MFAFEYSRQWLFCRFNDDAFPHPLPELCLSGPELFAITTDNQRCFFLALLLPVTFGFSDLACHLNTPPALHGLSINEQQEVVHTQNPVGKPLLRGSIDLSKRGRLVFQRPN